MTHKHPSSPHHHSSAPCTDHIHPEHSHISHEASLWDELGCHLPWTVFSLGLGFILLSILHFIGLTIPAARSVSGYHVLFHVFHYLHITYAVVGTFVTFARFSPALFKGVIVSVVSCSLFCTLSDVALPTLAGNILGVSMDMHICFFSELHNVLPLLAMGVITGLFLRKHQESALLFYSLGSHFVHVLIASLAALFYMASYGFNQWYETMGFLFFFLVIAVVVPCTLSDLVVPWYFAHSSKKHEKHNN